MTCVRVAVALVFAILQMVPAASVFAQSAPVKVDDSADAFSMPQAAPPGVPLDSPEGRKQRLAEPSAISPLQKRVTVVSSNVTMTTFLNTISMQSGMNFIVAEDVGDKKITASLRNVTVQEALQVLLQIRGLSYQRIGTTNTYLITKRSSTAPNRVTKIYTLNYISLINSTGISGGGSGASSYVSGEGSSGSVLGSGGSGSSGSSASGVDILTVIKDMLTGKGRYSVEPRTNSLIITDVPDVFPQIDALISELDRKTPQILIEAQIVEVNTDRINELGIDWGGSSGQMIEFVGGSRNTDYFLKDGFFNNGWKTFFPPSSSESGTITPGYLSLQQMQVVFRALVSRSEARYLGKPKVVTMNNKPATISMMKHAAVGLKSDVSGSGSVGQTTQEAEREWVGLELQVVPQVNKEGYITMLVVPHFSDTTASAITVNNVAYQDKIERTVQTLVRVKNGQTVVLGGMLYSKDNKVVRKVPLLGYIPILGWFFSSTSSRKQNTDVVMFITPTILVD